MKRYFIFLIALFLSLSLFAQDKNYTITVSARKYSAPYMAYLQYKGKNGEVKDSVAVKDGTFTFSGMIDEPRPASIVLKEPGKKISSQDIVKFYIEPGNLSATARSLFSNAEIMGSPSTKDNIELSKILAISNHLDGPPRITEVTQIVAVPAGSGPPSSSTGVGRPMPTPGPGVTKRVITDMNELPYEVRSAIQDMREEAKDKVLKFISDHPASFVSMYTVNSLWQAKKISYNEYIDLVNVLDKRLLQSNEGKFMFPH
jgi:hypothetical protein